MPSAGTLPKAKPHGLSSHVVVWFRACKLRRLYVYVESLHWRAGARCHANNAIPHSGNRMLYHLHDVLSGLQPNPRSSQEFMLLLYGSASSMQSGVNSARDISTVRRAYADNQSPEICDCSAANDSLAHRIDDARPDG